MMGSGNKNYNSQINRKSPQHQINEDTPNPKLYQNYYNRNVNNRQNIKINMNMNSNIKNRINDNMNNINSNINNNTNNNIRNTNTDINNNNINKALMILRSEFKKKDERIKSLELKVADLERKINMIKLQNQNMNANQNNNINIINNKNISLPLNFTFQQDNSGGANMNMNANTNQNQIRKNKADVGVGSFRVDNNYFPQTNSLNQFKVNNNQNMLEKKYSTKSDNLTEGVRDSSLSGNSQIHSKNEVKLYLKEVKQKVEPHIFKEFIKNIKLLTSSRETNGIDKNIIVENVQSLFGEQYKDLFIKFESIIGVNE